MESDCIMRLPEIANYGQYGKSSIKNSSDVQKQSVAFKGRDEAASDAHTTSAVMEYLHNLGEFYAASIPPTVETFSGIVKVINNRKAGDLKGGYVELHNSHANTIIADKDVLLDDNSSATLINSNFAILSNSHSTKIHSDTVGLTNESTAKNIESGDLVTLDNSKVNGSIALSTDNKGAMVSICNRSTVDGNITIDSNEEDAVVVIDADSKVTGCINFLNKPGKVYLVKGEHGATADINQNQVVNGTIARVSPLMLKYKLNALDK